MLLKTISKKDTIVAISTPQGIGAIGMVRLSGNRSWQLVEKIINKKIADIKKAGTFFFSKIFDGDEILDEVIVLLYQHPHSFTGDDMVELCCHGSPYILNRVMELCLQHGARQADPGEFSMRAYLNEKIDLTKAEAISDLIHSHTRSAHKTAMNNLKGNLKKRVEKFKQTLKELVALMELELDFSDEDVEFASKEKMKKILLELESYCKELVNGFCFGNALKNGFSVALIGEPNVGKSSLLNSILNEDKAIVSNIPGTTRDAVEDTFVIKDVLFRFIDTAGLRESNDVIETMGINKSLDIAKKADIIILMLDAKTKNIDKIKERLHSFQEKINQIILVANKADKLTIEEQSLIVEKLSALHSNAIIISVLEQQNIDKLKQAIYDKAVDDKLQKENTILINVRHKQCFQNVLNSIAETKNAMQKQLPTDLIIIHLKECLKHLSDITGHTTNDDILDIIFSKFCIGK